MAAADFNVSKFKGALAGGGARPSLFEFNVTGLPTNISIGNINYFCQVSALPPLTVTPIEKTYFGRTVKIPGDIVYGDLSTTIFNTEDYHIRNAIEKWMDKMNGHVSNTGFTNNTDWVTDIDLLQFSKDGESLMLWNFRDCWPTTLAEIPLSYDTASDIEQFDVTWAYNYYTTYSSSTKISNGTHS